MNKVTRLVYQCEKWWQVFCFAVRGSSVISWATHMHILSNKFWRRVFEVLDTNGWLFIRNCFLRYLGGKAWYCIMEVMRKVLWKVEENKRIDNEDSWWEHRLPNGEVGKEREWCQIREMRERWACFVVLVFPNRF